MRGATHRTWYKSTYSSGEGGDCVEVAVTHCSVHVRDSKDTVRSGLTVGTDAWAAFVEYAVDRAV